MCSRAPWISVRENERMIGRRELGVVTLVLALSAASSAPAAAPLGPVSVQVPRNPSATANLTIGFHPRGQLPRGGYYYAVVVLVHYPRSPGEPAAPSCALSSDMHRTDYGFPRRGRALSLTLLPAGSAEHRWCQGGSYEGAVYAVPHRPPCSKAYPCYGKSSCGSVPFCGVVIKPGPYSYPGGLPRPIDRSTRVVGRFTLTVPS